MFELLSRVFTTADSRRDLVTAESNEALRNAGLDVKDVNFYFAAVSVCSALLNPFQSELEGNKQQLSPRQHNQHEHEEGGSMRSSNEPSPGSSPSSLPTSQVSGQNQAPFHRSFSRRNLVSDPQPAQPFFRGRYDFMNYEASSKPKETYYVPKLNRMASRTRFQGPSAENIQDKQRLIDKLKRDLEQYRMLVTNRHHPFTPPHIIGSNQAVEVLKRKDSKIVSKPEKEMNDLNGNRIDFNQKISASDENTSKLTKHSNDFQLLTRSPELERELAETAARVWGSAVGFDSLPEATETAIKESSMKERKTLYSELEIYDSYEAQRDHLRSEIEDTIQGFGLTDELKRKLVAVDQGRSKFHQAQEVVPGLWVGPFYVASNRLNLYSLQITHIVCCVPVQPPFVKDFHYLVLPCQDKSEQDILRFLPKTNEFIRNALSENGRVFVHCGAGVSRAPTVCAAFLIEELRVSSEIALRMVQAARPFADPNAGFRQQLQTFQSIVEERLISSSSCGSFDGRDSAAGDEQEERKGDKDSKKEEQQDEVTSSSVDTTAGATPEQNCVTPTASVENDESTKTTPHLQKLILSSSLLTKQLHRKSP